MQVENNCVDELTMRLVHYFITKENYQPVIVNGTENEIWLENSNSIYNVIRISTNYIHNDEQLEFDMVKTKNVIKQIKKKTMKFKCKTLNIFFNLGENVNRNKEFKNMELFDMTGNTSVMDNSELIQMFPEIQNDLGQVENPFDFIISVTDDINKATDERNKLYDKTFRKKQIMITYFLIAINILVFLAANILELIDINDFAMNGALVKNGDYYRLFTAAFFHGNIVHLFANMYSLYVIGTQLETFIGRTKFTIVYIISILTSSLLSGVLNAPNIASVGASGAIFGIMGAILYFGYYFRLYLGGAFKSQIVPVILINLFIGCSLPFVDNYGHIGGLVGGLFGAMMVGIEGKTNKKDKINGTIVTIILVLFLIFMLFR